MEVEAPGGAVAAVGGFGEGPVAHAGAVAAGPELEGAALLRLEGDLVQGGLAVQVVVGHNLAVDDQVARVAGRKLHAHDALAQVEVALRGRVLDDNRVHRSHLGRPAGAVEPEGQADDGGGGDQGDDDSAHHREGSSGVGNRCSDASSSASTAAANETSTKRRASGMRGANTAATAMVGSHSMRTRAAQAWRRTNSQQTGYLRASSRM